MARSFVVGSLLGFVVVFSVAGAIAVIAGTGWGPALGIGSFAGFWGGPGFGGMLGAVMGAERASAAPEAAHSGGSTAS
jgi:hypothetical protein